MSKLPAPSFGLARLKKEGAPAHPEDVYIHCGCAECEKRWQKQLKAYNEYYATDSAITVHLPIHF